MKLKCVVIDDEPVAVQGLKEHIGKVDFLELHSTFTSPLYPEVANSVRKADLLFLDIHMPEITGIEFLKSLEMPPTTIFTTAYSNYALDGFALDVIDYLVKPIPYSRFLKAVTKAKDLHSLRLKAQEAEQNHFFIKVDNKQEKILYDDVLFVEARQHFVTIHTSKRKMVSYITMGGMEDLLPKQRFVRIHKSFIISLNKVESFTPEKVQIGLASIPVSRNSKKEVMSRLLQERR